MLLGGSLGPWQVLLMSPKGRNTSRDGFVNLKISVNDIASFGSLASSALALLFYFSLIKRSLSIVTTWSWQYNFNRLDAYRLFLSCFVNFRIFEFSVVL